MNVPPASTNRSRIAKDVGSSVTVPKRIAPRLRTLTSRRVRVSVPIVRYFMRLLSSALQLRVRGRSLDAGVHSRSSRVHFERGHRYELDGAQPLCAAGGGGSQDQLVG